MKEDEDEIEQQTDLALVSEVYFVQMETKSIDCYRYKLGAFGKQPALV